MGRHCSTWHCQTIGTVVPGAVACSVGSLYIGDMTNGRLVKWPIGAKQGLERLERVTIASSPGHWATVQVRFSCKKATTGSSCVWKPSQLAGMAPAIWWIQRSVGPQLGQERWLVMPKVGGVWLGSSFIPASLHHGVVLVQRSVWSVKDGQCARCRNCFFDGAVELQLVSSFSIPGNGDMSCHGCQWVNLVYMLGMGWTHQLVNPPLAWEFCQILGTWMDFTILYL